MSAAVALATAEPDAAQSPTGADPDTLPSSMEGLMLRVLDALLREDHLGLQSRGELRTRPRGLPASGEGRAWNGPWWSAPLPDGRAVHLPVRPDGFLAPWRLAAALVAVEGPGPRLAVEDTLEGALAALAPVADPAEDPEAAAGWSTFTEECRQTSAVVRLHDGAAPRLYGLLAAEPSSTAARGCAGLLPLEAVAALRDHPVHPTGRCRWGLSEEEVRVYAPEYAPEFRLRWAVVPRTDVRLSAALGSGLPPWWPTPTQLGLPSGADDELVALPVHPLTAARGEVACIDAPGPAVVPTLSTRTVALADDPRVHLKLPLPTATLGSRNRRTIKPGSLAGGEAFEALLGEILAREPGLAGQILLADETRWADSGSDLHAVLVREFPHGLERDRLAPLAALPAHAPSADRTVLELLAAEAGLDAAAWFDAYVGVLLDWHVALWLRYGIALEAHQQNITVAQGPAGLRLVYKDNDSGRIDLPRLSAALGRAVPADTFADPRIAVQDPGELADMVTTITLHLCIGAIADGLAGGDAALRASLFGLARIRLEEAAERWCDPDDAGSVAAARMLRERILDAEALPVKGMVTAGTLLPKERLGCADVNKYYLRTGPNWLRQPAEGREARRGALR